MSEYIRTDRRQRQIVDAALRLLATEPVAQLTTRQIAKALGLTQPALFRHFASREEILVAVVATARADLAEVVERTLCHPSSGLHRAQMLVQGVIQHAEAHPGLPRLLFADIAEGSASPTRVPVAALLSMLAEVVAELLRTDQRAGRLAPDLDAQRAALSLIALVQGTLLQWQLGNRGGSLRDLSDTGLAMWCEAVERAVPSAQATLKPAPATRHGIAQLDVRPILAAGTDPLQAILAHLQGLESGGMLKLLAPFRPAPLLMVLSARGHAVQTQQRGPQLWELEILDPAAHDPEDLRDLEAPLPLEHVLTVSATLEPGSGRLFRLPRMPTLLLPHLQERGLCHALHAEADGSAILWLGRPA